MGIDGRMSEPDEGGIRRRTHVALGRLEPLRLVKASAGEPKR